MARGFKQASDSLNEESKYNPESVSEFAKEAESTTIPSTVKFSKGFAPSKPSTNMKAETTERATDKNIHAPKRRSKAKIMVGIVASVMVVIAIFIIFALPYSLNNLEIMLNINYASGIVKLYENKCENPSEQREFSDRLIEYEDKLYDKYNNGLITFEQAHSHYDTINEIVSRLDLDIEVQSMENSLYNLEESKGNFEVGLELINQLRTDPNGVGNASASDLSMWAMECFGAVLSDDTNYPEARKLAEEAAKYYKINEKNPD